ncbi:hypothetical protein N7517_004573 [Penicillium concentricum]|uniref:Uncharacterized protein n=1 Tax=Penicillium concentricum TaxID=293559 RepID=A0A9W9V8E1_9EURO|nr:uncharacterized protein N7517_004573 [Penicillium concentricum]KAJ5372567.1 hypothetical protein N7517_004573 [Penicillium concentricum]
MVWIVWDIHGCILTVEFPGLIPGGFKKVMTQYILARSKRRGALRRAEECVERWSVDALILEDGSVDRFWAEA